jgi:hypothetical protein
VSLRLTSLQRDLGKFFECMVEVPRIKIGQRQTIETLVNEEALLFAKLLRDERKAWTPRIAVELYRFGLGNEFYF